MSFNSQDLAAQIHESIKLEIHNGEQLISFSQMFQPKMVEEKQNLLIAAINLVFDDIAAEHSSLMEYLRSYRSVITNAIKEELVKLFTDTHPKLSPHLTTMKAGDLSFMVNLTIYLRLLEHTDLDRCLLHFGVLHQDHETQEYEPFSVDGSYFRSVSIAGEQSNRSLALN